MKDWFKRSNRLGIFLAFVFVVCFIWYWLRPVHQELHMQLLELCFYGFRGMNIASFVLGVIQSYVWGYIAVALWNLACCITCCKCVKKD